MPHSALAPVGRYAPSPTGSLHLGNLRTALAAWAHNRSRGGRFLLRIEDLDRPRVVEGSERRQLADLATLGIDWDEEPGRQSDRSSIYQQHFERLRMNRLVYPCFCSRRDIRTALSAPHIEDGVTGYPGTCRSLEPSIVTQRLAKGDQHCWRLRTDGAPCEFVDGLGVTCSPGFGRNMGDFVVLRADGLFAYQLACAVDDSSGGITEVLRGSDLLESGARQTWVLECLGLPVPKYIHIPLMVGEDGRRLAKRRGSDDLAGCLTRGLDAECVRSYLAWTLGQCPWGQRTTMQDLAARFDLKKIPREEVVYRPEDMDAFRS